MKVEDGNIVYDSRDNCNAIIEKSTNTLLFGCMNTIIPNSVTKIGKEAFYGCAYMTSITIPNNIISIGENAFTNCSGLLRIFSGIQNPFIIDYNVFGISSSTIIIVPKGTKQLYMSTKGWNHWKIVEDGDDSSILEKRTIHVPTAGTLPDLTTEYEKYAIEELKLTGEINGTDVKLLRNMPLLTRIDLSEVHIIQGGESYYTNREPEPFSAGDYYYVPYFTADNSLTPFFFTKLTSVIIPNSVTSISNNAFSDCTNLISITTGITTPFDIGEYAFSNYTTATLFVPAGKKSIYQNTAGWSKFQKIVEQGGVGYEFEFDGIRYKIGENNTVSVIRRSPKYSGDVVIPSQVSYNGVNYTVTTIGSMAFGDYCTGLTSITIPPTVTCIEDGAFYDNLFNLNAVHISDLDAWCSISINGIYSETCPLYWAKHLYLNGEEVKDLVIPNGVTSINNATFYGCSLTSVTIPNSVTSIGNCAFLCDGLTTITSEIINPFEIGNSVFSHYTTATLIVPAGKKTVYQNTAGWNEFQNIVEVGGVDYEFEKNGIRYKIGEDNTVTVVSKDSKYSGDLSIPNKVEFNGSNYSVTTIGKSAFEGCVDITSIIIPNSVTTIDDGAFYYCTGLTTVDIPNGVTTIGEGAFSKCGGLTSVTIPSSVTSIGTNAFFQCYGLTQITSWIENPFAIDNGVFPTSVYNNAYLLVPIGTKAAYQNTSGWKRFQKIRVKIAGDVNFNGDVNADGWVNKDDLDALVTYIMGEVPNDFDKDLANLNGDDDVNAADVVKLVTILNLQDGLSTDWQPKFNSSQVITSLSCTLNNNWDKAIQVTKCELYHNQSLVSYSTFNVTLASGENKKCFFDELADFSAKKSFYVVWHCTYNGENYTYRFDLPE